MTENTLFPGRPNYTGPNTGWFGLLHHDVLCEFSHNVNERVEYVRDYKPAHEIAIRLHNMISLRDCPAVEKRDALDSHCRLERDLLIDDCVAKRNTLINDYGKNCDALDADYKTILDMTPVDYRAKRAALSDDYKAKLEMLFADYEAKVNMLRGPDYKTKRNELTAEIVSYIKQHIPDCAWNGQKLLFL